MIEIAALWKNRTREGTEYFSGKINGATLFVFENSKKTAPKQPDYRVYISEPRTCRRDTRARTETEESGEYYPDGPKENPPVDDSGCPF